MALEKIGVEATIEGLSSFRRGIGQMDNDVRGFGRSAGGIVSDLDSMGSALLNIGGIAAGAVVAGLAAATGAAVAFAGSGIKAAIDMEDQMGNIAAVMNTTKEEIQPLADLILELGIDPGLKVTAEEAANAIELLARNGLSMTEIMGGAAKATVLLANATGAEFGNAADIATDAMAIFGIEAEDMLGVVDSIVSVTTNSKFTIDDFSLAIRNGGAAADLMGVSLDDFNTVIAATAEEMGSGMRAGTGFRNFLMRLTPNSEKAAEAMMELGLITKDGANQFFDAQGNIKSMAEVSGVLQEALKDLTAQEQSAFLELIFGQDALGTAIGLANEGEEGFRALAESMSETDAAAAALERMDSVAGVFEILGGVIDTVKLQIGQAFLPLVRDLADEFLVIANNIGPKIVDVFSGIADGIGEFVSLLQGGESPLDALFGALEAGGISPQFVTQLQDIVTAINDFVDPIIDFVSNHAEAFKGAFVGIAAALGTGVIVSVLTTIAGLVAALVSPVGLLIAGFAALGAGISHFGGIQQIVENIQNFIQTTDFAALGQDLIARFLEGMSNLGESFAAWRDNFLSSITDAINNIDWTAVGESVITFIGNAIAGAVGLIAIAIQGLYNFFKGAFDLQDWPVLGTNLINAIINALSGFAAGVMPVLQGWYEAFINWVQSVDWVQIGLNIVMFVVEGLVNFATNVAETLGSWYQAFADWVESIDWYQIGYDIVTFIIDAFQFFTEEVPATFLEWTGKFVEWVQTTDWKQLAIDLIVKIVAQLGEFWFYAAPTIQGWWDSIKSWFDSIDWGALAQAIIDGLVSGISNGVAAVGNAVANLAQGAIDAAKDALGIESPSKVFAAIGVDIGTGLIVGIKRTATSVQESIAALFDIGGALGGIGSGFANQLKNDVLPKMESAIDQNQQTFDRLKNRFANNFGSVFGITDGEGVTQQRLMDAYFTAVHTGNEQMKNDVLEIWQAQGNLTQSTNEYKKAQADILALQKAQQDLAFLEQQQKLLELITENGLNAKQILGGLELGLGADTQGLVQAMTRAIQAIVNQANEQLQIASPSGVFKQIGRFITTGLAEGISQTATSPAQAMESMINRMVQPVQSQAAMPSVINQPSTTTITKSAQVDMSGIQVGNEMDLQFLGDFVLQKVSEAIQ